MKISTLLLNFCRKKQQISVDLEKAQTTEDTESTEKAKKNLFSVASVLSVVKECGFWVADAPALVTTQEDGL